MSHHRAFPSSVQAAPGLELRLARPEDAAAIAEWTCAPEVYRTWGGEPVSMDEVRAKYTGLRAPEVVSYVICEHGRPVGYLQAWQRAGAYGLDMFLAAESQGRGLGPAAARALAEELIVAGWAPLTVDPALENRNAIAAWRSAGFVESEQVRDDDGVLTQVMTFVSALRHVGE